MLDVTIVDCDEVIHAKIEDGVKGEKGDKGDQGPPVPLAQELGESEELAVSQKLLTDIVGDIESAGHEGTKFLYAYNTQTTNITARPPLFIFNTSDETVEISARFGVQVGGGIQLYDGGVFSIPSGTQDKLIILNIRTGGIRLRNIASSLKLSEEEFVICAFSYSRKEVYAGSNYSFGDDDDGGGGGGSEGDTGPRLPYTPFSMVNGDRPFIADFDFKNNVIKHDSFRYIHNGKSVSVSAQDIQLDPKRIDRNTFFICVDAAGVLKSVPLTTIPKSVSDEACFLYAYNERMGVVFTTQKYKVNGVEVGDGGGGGGGGGGGEGNTEPSLPTLLFNSEEPPTIIKVDDSHTDGDPLPLSGAFASATLKPDVVNGWFDELVTEYPDYVSKEQIGVDESGKYPIIAYRFKPAGVRENSPRIMLSAVHAETLNHVYLHVLMREVCKSWDKNPRLSALRWGAEFSVIPAAHPYGMEKGTRVNVNGVDINRNFPVDWSLGGAGTVTYSGPSPASESETKALIGEFERFKPHFAIDAHAFGGPAFVWASSRTERYDYVTRRAALVTYQKFKELKKDDLSFDGFLRVTRSPGGTMSAYISGNGMIGGTFEASRNKYGGGYIDNEEIIVSTSMLMNMIYEGLKIYV